MNGHVYKTVELTGSSQESIEDAIKGAIARARHSIRHLRWFEVTQVRGDITEGGVDYYQVTLKVGFMLDENG